MPNSGSAPYVLTAIFESKNLIDGVNYSLELRGASLVGSCPLPSFTSTNNATGVTSFLASDTYTISSPSIPEGSCNVQNLIIRNVVTGAVVSNQYVSISNV